MCGHVQPPAVDIVITTSTFVFRSSYWNCHRLKLYYYTNHTWRVSTSDCNSGYNCFMPGFWIYTQRIHSWLYCGEGESKMMKLEWNGTKISTDEVICRCNDIDVLLVWFCRMVLLDTMLTRCDNHGEYVF